MVEVDVRLPYRSPFDATGLFGFLATRAVPGIEAGGDDGYARTIRLAHGPAAVQLRVAGRSVVARLDLADGRDQADAVHRCSQLLDLDADPRRVDAGLGRDPLLGPVARARPGCRLPGHPDGAELVTRAIIGQQVTVAGGRTIAAQLVARAGDRLPAPVPTPWGPLTHLFPAAEAVAADAPNLPMPRSRQRAVAAVASEVAAGRLAIRPGVATADLTTQLTSIPGIGRWTAGYVALRVLSDPDVFLATDVGVRRAVARLGGPDRPAELERLAERWRPFRSYAVLLLWSTLTREKEVSPS